LVRVDGVDARCTHHGHLRRRRKKEEEEKGGGEGERRRRRRKEDSGVRYLQPFFSFHLHRFHRFHHRFHHLFNNLQQQSGPLSLTVWLF
jgi:hypothetical protein